MTLSRRDFVSGIALGTLASAGGAPALATEALPKQRMQGQSKPIIVSAGNGYEYLGRAYDFLKGGGDTLEAAIHVVRGPEDEPNDYSVGIGGLPNEEGVVELDASCMHGPTRRAGSAGGVRNIRSMAQLAREVMLHSGHVMLVGEGAEFVAPVADQFREPRDQARHADPPSVGGH